MEGLAGARGSGSWPGGAARAWCASPPGSVIFCTSVIFPSNKFEKNLWLNALAIR